jgi:hypothetical protein
MTLVKVLHHRDQLPLCPHSDAVGWEKGVKDLERDKGREVEVLQCDADGGGALSDNADVRRCGEELEQARTRVLAEAEAQRQRIAIQLRNSVSDGWAQEGERGLTVTYVVADKRSNSIGSQRS